MSEEPHESPDYIDNAVGIIHDNMGPDPSAEPGGS